MQPVTRFNIVPPTAASSLRSALKRHSLAETNETTSANAATASKAASCSLPGRRSVVGTTTGLITSEPFDAPTKRDFL